MIDDYKNTNIEEVALRLSRVPRFNGQTIVPWTVLHHIMAGYDMVEELAPMDRLMWLLHDAEEAWVGDTPSPFKTGEQSEYGSVVRRVVFRALDVPYDEPRLGMLSAMDKRLAAGEASAVCFPSYRSHFKAEHIESTLVCVEPLIHVPAHALVDPYIDLFEELMEHPSVRARRRVL